MRGLSDRGIGFKSIQESLDTTSSGGRLVFHVFGAIAEFERDLIRERTNAELEAARARGKKGGRKRALTDKQISIRLVAALVGLSTKIHALVDALGNPLGFHLTAGLFL